MAIRDDTIIEGLLYSMPHAQRLLQDTPVMPGLWAEMARNPTATFNILLTPHRETRASQAARQVREYLAHYLVRPESIEPYPKSDFRISPLGGQISAQMNFFELVFGVLVGSQWWQDKLTPYRSNPNLGIEELQSLLVDALVHRQLSDSTYQGDDLVPNILWLVRLVGAIHCSALIEQDNAPIDRDIFYSGLRHLVQTPQRANQIDAEEDGKAVAKLIVDGVLKPLTRKLVSKHGLPIHRIARNRPVSLAVNRSSKTIKADAARRLFELSCHNITWAVIDSGIDTKHPAFHDQYGDSRVDAVYDFTVFRKLNDLFELEEAIDSRNGLFDQLLQRQEDTEDSDALVNILQQHRQRLEDGLDVDYNLIEPLLRVANPDLPKVPHGTHVAGILGANWLDPLDDEPIMCGVCPDIRLYDFRVFDPDIEAQETDVIAALEFIRHLNSRSGYLMVHGANLSISIDQDLRDGDACGQTPVCEECEKTVKAGVTVVAAAGNRGNITVQHIANNRLMRTGIYLDTSITDPGNANSVITVGATHRNRPHEYGVSFFSSRGPTGDGRAKPDLVAPGEKITGPGINGDQYESDGTSMAAPHVSGAAALIMARHAELIGQPTRVKEILCSTATDLNREKYFQGHGLVDVLRALQSI